MLTKLYISLLSIMSDCWSTVYICEYLRHTRLTEFLCLAVSVVSIYGTFI